MTQQIQLPARPDSVILKGQVLPAPRAVLVTGTQFEMGKQHGEQMRDLILHHVQSVDVSLKALGFEGERLEAILAKNEDLILQMTPDMMEELLGISEGVKISVQDALKIYLAPDMGYAIPYDEMRRKEYDYGTPGDCTAFAMNTGATSDGNPLVLQNRDSSATAEGTQKRITVVAKPVDRYALVSHSRPGRNGGFGLNEKGLAFCATAVNSLDSVMALAANKPCGIQGYTLGKLILENCATIDEAMAYLKTSPGGYMGLNILLADSKGGVVRLERSYAKKNFSYPEVTLKDQGNYISCTNHFPSRYLNPLSPPRNKYPGSYQRHDRARELLRQHAGQIDLDTLFTFARDHANGPGQFSICNHGEKICTNASILSQPAKQRLFVLTGTVCQNEYVAYKVPA